MTRTVAREIAVQILFAVSRTGESAQEALDSFFDKEYYELSRRKTSFLAPCPGKSKRNISAR